MNVTIGDLAVIVRNPTALETAGATIVSRREVWIPPTVLRRGVITDGCGNGAGMEITNRFSHRLGNLAQDREIPTFPQAASCCLIEERTEKTEELNDAVNLSTESDQAQSRLDLRDVRSLERPLRLPVSWSSRTGSEDA